MASSKLTIYITLTENMTFEHTYIIPDDKAKKKEITDELGKGIGKCFEGSMPFFVLKYPSRLYIRKYVKCISVETTDENDLLIEEAVERHMGFPTPDN